VDVVKPPPIAAGGPDVSPPPLLIGPVTCLLCSGTTTRPVQWRERGFGLCWWCWLAGWDLVRA